MDDHFYSEHYDHDDIVMMWMITSTVNTMIMIHGDDVYDHLHSEHYDDDDMVMMWMIISTVNTMMMMTW